MAADPRRTIGASGEDAALRAHRARGYRAVDRKWRCRAGELDLVLARRGTLVFCEVKTRSGGRFGGGYEAVTWAKRRKLRQLAELYLQAHGVRPHRIRFDVASVWLGGGPPAVEVFEDAF
jgi:putative endonuclease